MKEEKINFPLKGKLDEQQQEEFYRKFNADARKTAEKDALKRFGKRAKEIKLNHVYSETELTFFFDLNWEKLETVLREKFEFITEGENITFNKVKEGSN